MKVLLLGVGMQGKAALFDLATSSSFDEIVAADGDLNGLRDFQRQYCFGSKVRLESLDAGTDSDFNRLLDERPDVVLDFLPVEFVEKVALAAVSHGVNLVNTCFVRPGILDVEQEAIKRGVTILPEFGVDPGIDLLLLGNAIGMVDEVEEIRSYGAGLPEPSISNDNPLRYKVTWTLEGVLNAYYREARLVRDGKVFLIPANELFANENVHSIEIEGMGELEAYPNGDGTKLASQAGLDPKKLRHLGCYTMRWPGHVAFWKPLVDLGLLNDSPIEIDGIRIPKRRFLAWALEPVVKLEDGERDVVIIRVEVIGKKKGKSMRIVNQMVDSRDLKTGFTAMSRTVGFTAAIGAELLASGAINKKGIASAISDVPFDQMKKALEKRGITLTGKVC